MLKYILIAIAVAIVGLLVYAGSRPGRFTVERTALIEAPPERIFPLIDNFKRWSEWSPYDKLDPDMKRTYSGPEAGIGSVYEWSGNSKAGAGRMEILESMPSWKIVIQLDFIKPFKATNTAEFTIAEEGGATRVTWAMYGRAPYISKLMGIFIDMDKMIGKDFETGLANIKAIAEKG